jgi:hypothetical protein
LLLLQRLLQTAQPSLVPQSCRLLLLLLLPQARHITKTWTETATATHSSSMRSTQPS